MDTLARMIAAGKQFARKAEISKAYEVLIRNELDGSDFSVRTADIEIALSGGGAVDSF